MRIGNVSVGIFRSPLLGASRTLLQFPLMLEQVLEIIVTPLRRRLRPDDLRAASDGVGTDTRTMTTSPAQALVLDLSAFRLRSHERWIAGAMRLAEGVTTGNQRDGFLVVHRHTCECLTDVVSSCDRIGIAVRSFRVDVDESHLHRAQWLLKLSFAAVTFVT